MHTTPAPTPSPTAAPPVHLLLAVGLGLVGLARPITNTVLDQIGVDPGPVVPLGWTLLITLLWVAVVGLGRVPRPLLTLTLAGLVYGLSALLLSGILSPLLLGRLEGPLAHPIAIVPMLVTNTLWGLVAGALALAIQRARR